MTMKIFVRPVNIGSVDQEYYEIEVAKTQSLREVYLAFQTYLSEELNCGEDEYDFDIDRIAIIQQSRPNTKLSPSDLISKIYTDGNNSDKFTFIFPRDSLPIVQIHDGEKYYYIDDYGKNQLLYYIVEKKEEIQEIIKNKEYEYIKINGVMIDYKAEKDKPFKGFLQNRMNTMVNISIKLKDKKEEQGGKKEVEVGKKEEVVKTVRQSKNVEVNKKVQTKWESKDQKKKDERQQIVKQKEEEKRQPKKQQKPQIKKEEKVEQPQSNVPAQEPQPQPQTQPQPPANLPKQQPNKDLLKLVIKFQSNTSNKKQEFLLSVDPNKSMLQLLPQIVDQLKSRGFHWQQTGFDKSRGDLDKLSIIYAGSQFKKIERQLRSFVNFPQESKMLFTFERHYDGGA